MAHTGDADLQLSQEGDLVSLYKNGTPDVLLRPEQVANCVKFKLLSLVERLEEGKKRKEVLEEPYRGEKAGLKVNVFAGPTGTGKTSLIRLLVGGRVTPSKARSDTKCPTVYVVKLGGVEYAILDTAGLCDTEAIAKQDVRLQELLINTVAATIKKYGMTIVSFFMCVSMQGRLPGNFAEVWPQMQVALGGDELHRVCQFVITVANADSEDAREELADLPKSDLYGELKYSSLKWPLLTAGRENLKAITAALEPATTAKGGIEAAAVDPDAESLVTKQQKVQELQRQMQEVRTQLGQGSKSQKDYIRLIQEQQKMLNDATETLASLGTCDKAEKKRVQEMIREYHANLARLQQQAADGTITVDSLQEQLMQMQTEFDKRMEEVKKMRSMGAFFRGLAGAVVDAVVGR